MGKRTILLAVAAVAVLVYLAPLGVRPLAAMDEYRYGEISREMLESGDWIVPRLNGLPYFEKPPLGYWLNALSLAALGENAFALRLPTALATLLAALAVWVLVRAETRDPVRAGLAALVHLTCLQVFALGQVAILDAMLTALLTGAMVAFRLADRAPSPGRRRAGLALCGALLGAAFLVKGVLALAIPVLAIGPYLLWERRARDLLRLPWIPILAAAAVAAPWCVAIGLREPDFWRYFLVEEHLGRFLGHGETEHPEPPWYFVQAILGGTVPWVVLAPAAVVALRRGAVEPSLLRYLLAWGGMIFLFFSASSGKLLPYVLPCYAPVAILLALGLHHALGEGRPRLLRWGTVALAVVLGGGVAAIAAAWIGGWLAPVYEPWEWFKPTLVLLGGAVWIALVLAARRAEGAPGRMVLFGLGPVAFLAAFPFAVPAGLPSQSYRLPGRLLAAEAHRIGPETILVSDGRLVHAVCWTFRRTDVLLLNETGELDYGLATPKGRARDLGTAAFRDLVAENAGRRRVVLIVRKKNHLKHAVGYPPPAVDLLRDGIWFRVYD